jgi:hypothetical protein
MISNARWPVGCLVANPTGDPGAIRAILQQSDLNQSANPIKAQRDWETSPGPYTGKDETTMQQAMHRLPMTASAG